MKNNYFSFLVIRFLNNSQATFKFQSLSNSLFEILIFLIIVVYKFLKSYNFNLMFFFLIH